MNALSSPAFNLRGSKIVLTANKCRGSDSGTTPEKQGLYVMDINGSNILQITSGNDGAPAWQPSNDKTATTLLSDVT